MDKKYQLSILCLLLFPLSAAAQEWSTDDSLKLRDILESEKEILLNKYLINEIENGIRHPKSSNEFDVTLPTLSLPFKQTHLPAIIHKPIRFPSSTLLPNFSWIKFGNNVILQSKSNFAKNQNQFHIQTAIEYKIADKWALNLYGTQNVNAYRHKALPSEVEPTVFGSDITFKISKRWKFKTGIQYQYNAILKKWEWIPKSSISYEW